MFAVIIILLALIGCFPVVRFVNGLAWRLSCRLLPNMWHRDNKFRWLYRLLFHWRKN
jgi:hypothetical protein